MTRNLAFVVLLALVAVTLATACTSKPPAPTDTTPTVAAGTSPTVVATPTSAAGTTPTPTRREVVTAPPIGTPTPTARPTATNVASDPNAYRNEAFGFALRIPTGWEREEGGSNPLLTLAGPTGLPVVYVSQGFEETPKTKEARALDYINEVKAQVTDFNVVSQGDVTMNDGTKGYRIDCSFSQQGGSVRAQNVFVPKGQRIYRIETFSTAAIFQSSTPDLQVLVASFSSFEPQPFGVDLKQALVIAASQPDTLDPYLSESVDNHQYIVMLYSGLVRLDDDLKIQPDLAEKWEIDSTGTVFTFHLRPNATFHNGKKVIADDVKYSIERAADPKTHSPTASTYLNDIVGVKAKLAGTAADVSGVRVIDPLTIEIRVDARKAYFLAKLTYPTSYVLDKDNVAKGPDWTRTPNGTGPFKLKGFTVDRLFVVERNDAFYRTPPSIKYLVMRLSVANTEDMYTSGLVDVTPVDVSTIERAKEPGSTLGKDLTPYSQLSINYLGFNARKAPFNDPDVRRAFAMAIDKSAMNEALFRDSVTVAKGLMPPGLPGFDASVQGIPFDAAGAKALLAKKYPDLTKLPTPTFTVAGTGTGVSGVVAAMIQMWKNNLGVTVSVRQVDPSSYYDELRRSADNLFFSGWITDYPDPENVLDVLFHTDQSNNYGGFSDSEADKLMDQARTETDTTKRIELYRQAERRLIDQAAVAPLFHDRIYVLVKPWVKGLKITAQRLYTWETATLSNKGTSTI